MQVTWPGPGREIPGSVARAAAALGTTAVSWSEPPFGLSAAERHVVRLAHGPDVFVKGATDQETAGWLRNEHHLLERVGGRLGPEILAWADDGRYPVLVTTDLSSAYWPAASGRTVWRPGDADALMAALGELRAMTPDPGLAALQDWPAPVWSRLVEGQIPVRLGICSATWLDRHGPALVSQDELVQRDNRTVVHGDVRSDNLCLLPAGQVRLVDWSVAGTGHPDHDVIVLLPTLHLEGGPAPATMLRAPADLVVRLAGPVIHRAANAGSMPGWLRDVFRRLASIQLDWIADIMELDPPFP